MSDQNKIRDFSSDKKYFMITPQLVWAVSRSPYDYTLWNVIKMIAGENGECYLCTEDLATLAMMSAGKASQCRKFLIEADLLIGEVRRDPGYPQPVWHLQIPDLWKQNVEWRQEFDDLSERIILKEEQKKSLHLMKPSPGEEPPSPDEEGVSPGEEPPSPDETKKNQVVEPSETQEEPKRGAAEETPPVRDYLTDLFNGKMRRDGLREGERLIQIADWDIRSPEHRRAMAAFLEASRLPIPKKKTTRKDWLGNVDIHVQTYGATELENLYPRIIDQMRGDNLTVSRPGSVTNNLADYWAKEYNGGKPNAQPTNSQQLTEHQKRIAAAFRATARNPGG